jgi:hypothetical protein
MIRLDDIEAKARAVNCPETWDATDFTIDDGNDGEFIGAMSPTTALALIRVARAARDYWQVYAVDEACALPEINRREKDLEEALKGVE